MKIIPVIDLKNGLVVHARLGRREHYLPLSTPLSPSADMVAVIDAFLGVYPFDTFYVADLDAITGTGSHERLISAAARAFPNLTFWQDLGRRPHGAALGRHWPVLGTESYDDGRLAELAALGNRFVLSLDFTASAPAAANRLFADDSLWPEQVIIMSLAKVGSHQGPDLPRLQHYRRRYPHKRLVAAGGIRGAEDLRTLAALGIGQALVASSLHSGALTGDDLRRLAAGA